jgi:dTDP-L-rhamnose 4-epimerase
MAKKTILITGGAGFIGSHLADHLLAHGYAVRALDDLSPQVHGEAAGRPRHLDREVDLVVGDVRDPQAVRRALAGVHGVFHLAACVGVGQSMYEVARYTSVNAVGTAVLLQALIEHPVERLVVASSMSLYGEGLYRDASGATVACAERSREQLVSRDWEPRGPGGERLVPLPTPESKAPALPSVYALSKFDQERLCLTVGRAYGIPTVALRFFNVYGTRQALSNPYTGVAAIFSSRILSGQPPVIYEDGRQLRDFVHVSDIVRACRLAMDSPAADYEVLNVGSGRPVSVLEVAETLALELRWEGGFDISQKFRAGDVRHCFADLGRIQQRLGYLPRRTFAQGVGELLEWVSRQRPLPDRAPEATRELVARGLVR